MIKTFNSPSPNRNKEKKLKAKANKNKYRKKKRTQIDNIIRRFADECAIDELNRNIYFRSGTYI